MLKSKILLEKLDFPRAHRSTRLKIAHWVIEHPNTFPDLLDYCFNTELTISHKAAWILEMVCLEKLSLLLPHLDSFFGNIHKIKKDQAVRPFSKICMMIATSYYKNKDKDVIRVLSPSFKESMTACCFDWMISDQKVAAEAYSMQALYLLGTEIKWIHPELKIIIEQKMNSKTAAYCARGRITLEKISKFNMANP